MNIVKEKDGDTISNSTTDSKYMRNLIEEANRMLKSI